MKKTIFAVSLITVICAAHAQIYKWTDSQGNVHFSDTPHEGAEQLSIPNAQSYAPPKGLSSPVPQPNASSEQKDHGYTKIAINQPQNEATIRNNQGYLVVAAQLEPDLAPGDVLQLIFDGSPLGDPQTALLFQLNGIYRGSHTIAIQVLDAGGNVLNTSEPITIFMHRPYAGMGAGGK
ncbi:MAG: DUF4124 domain-containing protein [Legionellales bacterium]